MSRRKGSGDAVSGTLRFALRLALWGAVCLFVLGFVSVACEAFGRGLEEGGGDARGLAGAAGDARATEVAVAAVRETTSELRAEMYAQALDAEGFEVERAYGLTDPDALDGVLREGDGAVVFPAEAPSGEANDPPAPGVKMLAPTREAVAGAHPAPVVGEGWAREHPEAVRALDETTARLDAREFEAMARAVDSGRSIVVAEVYEWRKRNGLPPAPGVKPPEPVEPKEARV